VGNPRGLLPASDGIVGGVGQGACVTLFFTFFGTFLCPLRE